MEADENQPKPRYGYTAALGLCALTTLAALPLIGHIDLANVILLYVLAVAVTATLWGRGPAVLSSFVGVTCFNFFFVPPRFSLTVDDAQYILTFAVMLGVSLLVGYLSNAYRAKAVEAERRAEEASLLHGLAQSLAGALSIEQLVELLEAFMQRRLGAKAALFLADSNEHVHAVGSEFCSISHVEQAAVQGVYVGGQSTGAIAELHGDDGAILLPLIGSTRRRGVLAVYVPLGGQPPEQSLLAAVAALVTTAVERMHFVEVAQASELEAASVRLRSSILSAISHDIRTPLTVLFGYADAIANGDTSHETATALRDQSYRLHRMVDNLLDMARLKSGKVELRRDWQSIPEIVAAGVKLLEPVLSQHKLRLEWPADLPLFRLDAPLMERVFCNLLENAVKYSPPGSDIAVSAAVVGNCATIWVDNEGLGFPPDRLDLVFGLFERGEAESATPGVGIGLSICHTIVTAHGGKIEAVNRRGGAQVRITLPCEVVPQVPQEDQHG